MQAQTYTQEELQVKMKFRDQEDTSANQGTPEIVRN